MKNVKVSKKWLANKVLKNRKAHRAAFEKAFDGYRQECIRVLEENLAAFRAGKRSAIEWREIMPQDHTVDYDHVVHMLDASVDDEVQLSAEEFACYVLDEWGWRQSWTVSNSKYLSQE